MGAAHSQAANVSVDLYTPSPALTPASSSPR